MPDVKSGEGGFLMKRLARIIIFAFFLAFALAASAGELYVWVDKKGNTHVTDQPPDESAKIIGTDSFRKSSTVESNRQVMEPARERPPQDQIDRSRSKARAAHEMESDARRERTRAMEEKRKADAEEKKIEHRKDVEKRKEILRALENRDYDEARRLQFRERERKLDQSVK